MLNKRYYGQQFQGCQGNRGASTTTAAPTAFATITSVNSIICAWQAHENTLARLVELNLKGFPHDGDIGDPPRTFFSDVGLTNSRQFVPNRFVNGNFVGQAAFEAATDPRDTRWVEGESLLFGHPHRNGGEFGQES